MIKRAVASVLFLIGLSPLFFINTYAEEIDVDIQETGKIKYFYRKYTLSSEEMQQRSESIAKSLAIAVVKKARTEITGPLTYVYKDLNTMDESSVTAKIGFPVKNSVRGASGYRFENLPPFRYLSRRKVYKKEDDSIDKGNVSKDAWKQLYTTAYLKGLKVTGESRTVVRLVEKNTAIEIELQLGIQ